MYICFYSHRFHGLLMNVCMYVFNVASFVNASHIVLVLSIFLSQDPRQQGNNKLSIFSSMTEFMYKI